MSPCRSPDKNYTKNEFKGQFCVYCGEAEATTADHIISREFFLVEQRDNLPQAPACRACNIEKTLLWRR